MAASGKQGSNANAAKDKHSCHDSQSDPQPFSGFLIWWVEWLLIRRLLWIARLFLPLWLVLWLLAPLSIRLLRWKWLRRLLAPLWWLLSRWQRLIRWLILRHL